MPKFYRQNKKRVDPRYFLNEGEREEEPEEPDYCALKDQIKNYEPDSQYDRLASRFAISWWSKEYESAELQIKEIVKLLQSMKDPKYPKQRQTAAISFHNYICGHVHNLSVRARTEACPTLPECAINSNWFKNVPAVEQAFKKITMMTLIQRRR